MNEIIFGFFFAGILAVTVLIVLIEKECREICRLIKRKSDK